MAEEKMIIESKAQITEKPDTEEPKKEGSSSKQRTESAQKSSGQQEKSEPETDEETVYKFPKPYTFEGKEYTEIDLSGLKDLKIKDAIDIQKQLEAVSQVTAATTTEFSYKLAQRATGKPIEFFEQFSRRSALKLRETVLYAITDMNESENHIIKFDKPYAYEGETYTEIDLNGLENMSALNEATAENRLTRVGYSILQPEKIYLYSCIMASMATGKPEEFFMEMPIRYLFPLIKEVGHEDFLE